MTRMMSACGVLCSDCPAYLAKSRGLAYQQRTAKAWDRIYRLNERAEAIVCGGCLSPDEEVFHTCQKCKARLCCRSKGFSSCAECDVQSCPDLEKAQSVWDGVPKLVKTLTAEDFAEYAQPYCGHRERLKRVQRAKG